MMFLFVCAVWLLVGLLVSAVVVASIRATKRPRYKTFKRAFLEELRDM